MFACLFFSAGFSSAPAGEILGVTSPQPTIESIKIEEELYRCGGTGWSIKVSTTHPTDEAQCAQLKAQVSSLMGLPVDRFTVSEPGERFVNFLPAHEQVKIPLITSEGQFTSIELRPTRQPKIEQVRFFRDPTGVSAIVRFKTGTSAIEQLGSLTAIAKFTEDRNATMSCGAESCGTTGCTECKPSCGCTGASPVAATALAAFTPGASSACDSSESCCADCSSGPGLKMIQIDERTYALEPQQK
jgi:hypothetical protein